MDNEPNPPQYGYPSPGIQQVTANDIMTDLFFMSDKEWDVNRRSGDFDLVVIGSSFCALAFAHRALKINPEAKILIIERGAYYHPEHFQNLPPAYVTTVGGTSETFHWSITKETHEGEYIKWQHGMNNFFGGRSSFWSSWCPEPTDEEMEDWPEEVIKVVHDYFPDAKKLLNVVPADEIFDDDKHKHTKPIFGKLQKLVQEALQEAPSKIDAITRVIPAPLAVGASMYRHDDYEKYSVPGPLLGLMMLKKMLAKQKGKPQPLHTVINCLVKKIHHNNGKATVLETSKGDFLLGNAKLVLAMGTLPPTTLVLNSFSKSAFPHLNHVGERFSSHFISSIIARVPRDHFTGSKKFSDLEFGAVYVAGVNKESNHQFHIQMSAVTDESPMENLFDTIRHLPDVVAAPSLEQLMTSKDHIIFVCACLGQLDHHNSQNWFRLNNGTDITNNVTLQVIANAIDNALWDTMDESTFQILETMLATKGGLEYWHSDGGSSGGWKAQQPTAKQIRVPGLVHESSTMWIGNDADKMAPVGLDYRLRGTDNIYVTGASLWPTGASWNPTCAMAGMAMHLADLICPASQSCN